MKYLNALEQSQQHVRTLWKVLIIFFCINLFSLVGWAHSQSKIQIVVPPAVPESGITLTEGQVPPTTVYSFAFYVWQSINHWQHNGTEDYRKQITQFSPFLTPSFKLRLVRNYNNLLNQGELQDRIRIMQGISGGEYSVSDVSYLGHGTWTVDLKMRLTEMMNSNAKIVKDVEMNYELKIVRFNVDAKQNPWGLAVAGFAQSPRRIKTIV